MKAVLNGALHLSTLDGWWAEAYDGTNGFSIGNGGEHSDFAAQDQIDLGSFFEVLETRVVPLYYERGEADIPRKWIKMQKNALRTLPWRFSCQRMVSDYAQKCYLPAVQGGPSAFVPVLLP
jgi:starch phosphorylase